MSTSSDEWRSKSPDLKQASAISALTAAIVSTPAVSALWQAQEPAVAPVVAPKGPVVMPQLYSRVSEPLHHFLIMLQAWRQRGRRWGKKNFMV